MMSLPGQGVAPSTLTRGKSRRNIAGRGRHPMSSVKVDFGALQIPYSDDDADLELKSEDGVVFKVQAFYLKAASGVFRAMLTTSAARNTIPQPPIEISSPSLIVRLFLDLAYHGPILSSLAQTLPPITGQPMPSPTSPPMPPQLRSAPPIIHFTDIFRAANAPYRGSGKEVACLSALLELLDRFECGIGMRDRALTHFEPTFSTDPWGVFCIAARYGDIPLAKKAIEKFSAIKGGGRANVDPDTILPQNVKQVHTEWWMGYERSYRRVARTYEACQQNLPENIEPFWKKIAAGFAPATSIRGPISPIPNPLSRTED